MSAPAIVEDEKIVPLFMSFEDYARQREEVYTEWYAQWQAAGNLWKATHAAIDADDTALAKFDAPEVAIAKADALRLLSEKRGDVTAAKLAATYALHERRCRQSRRGATMAFMASARSPSDRRGLPRLSVAPLARPQPSFLIAGKNMNDEVKKVATPRGDGRSMSTLSPYTVAQANVNFSYTGPDWMGPLPPMQPIAPPEVAGRTWDFIPGYNLADCTPHIRADFLPSVAGNRRELRPG